MSRSIWWHTCNENPGEKSGSKRRLWRAGRFFLHFYNRQITTEWHLTPKLDGGTLMFRIDHDEPEITFGIALLGLSFYLSLEGFHRPPKGVRWSDAAREVSLRVHDGSIWWCLWKNDNQWRPGDWRQSHFDVADFFLGKMHTSHEVLSIRETSVVLPEGAYPCTVELDRRTWWRARWPWRKMVRLGAEVKLPEHRPIPIPGKGENGWDCGDDAYYSFSCYKNTVEAALAHVHDEVIKRRLRYGGSDWTPEGGWNAEPIDTARL